MSVTDVAPTWPPRAERTWVPLRRVAVAGYLAGFLVQCLWWGWPTDTLLVFAWLTAGALCWNAGQPWRHQVRWVRDWAPVLALLVGYDYSRGLAAGRVPHVTEMIRADELLAGGALPTLWLQQHLYDPLRAHWWDVLASVVYLSHFVAVPGTAAALWLLRRRYWASFMRRWLFLTAAGLVTYFAYPAAPPWWASTYGYLDDHIERISARGWAAIGMDSSGVLLGQGQALANPVAAMPSLHSAFAMFLPLFFLPKVPKRWWPLLLAYPLAMTFTVVYCGEHYVVDVLAGWCYVLATMVAVDLAERWWTSHRLPPRPAPAVSVQLPEPVSLATSARGTGATAHTVPGHGATALSQGGLTR